MAAWLIPSRFPFPARPGRVALMLLSAVALLAGMVTVTMVAAPAAWALTANPTPAAGARRGATLLPFPVSGTAALSVDVGTGNALFSDRLFTLPGIGGDVPVVLSYNSSVWSTATPSAVTGTTGSGWVISGFDQRLVANVDGSVTYFGPGGLSGVFAPDGSGGFVAPPQFQATLTGSATSGYVLVVHVSQQHLAFTGGGRLTSMTDRNGNVTAFGYDPYGYPASITSTRGPTAARTVSVTTSSGRITTLTQASGGHSRSVTLAYSAGGHLASVTDTAAGVTRFASAYGTDTGQLVTVTNPKGKTTTLSFGSGGQVTQVAQFNPPIDGGAGESDTRLAYPSASQTLVADPTTNQSQPVGSVPHTTYDLTAAGLVSAATDPDGHTRSATYTTLGQLATVTPAAGGATTFTYGANSGESLTEVGFPQGATATVGYTGTGALAFLPSSVTDDGGNALQLTYDSNGNQLGTAQGATGPAAAVTYNSDGTPATSASPGAATGVVTAYGYNADHDLTGITPPAGTSLGSRAYTWDWYGRLATATDGAGHTITYGYDDADRITTIAYSDSTPSVGFTYDSNGRITQRVDGQGTTSYSYDDLGHLLATTNSANDLTVSYTYDLAGALATATDGAGTVTYQYDAAHLLTSMVYPQGGVPHTTMFANDDAGRRTDVWLQTYSGGARWAAHEHYDYDNSGRITHVLAQNGPASGPTTVFEQTLCYAANSAAPACSTATANDRNNIQWISNSVTGETTSYSYDDHNRLTAATITGGTDPRTYSYTYDAAGNRTTAAVTGTTPASQTLTFNAANQITTTGYSYDGAGNQTANPTRTATFNAAGQRLTATIGGATTTYSYAGVDQNELLTETVPVGRSYTYSYGRPDANGLPVIDTVVAGDRTGYVFHDPSGLPIMLQTNSGVTCLYLFNATGTPIGLATSGNTTSIALRYDPYGTATRTDGGTDNGGWTDNPYLYAQGLQDRVTGELKYGSRWYNPAAGNWTQQDTLNTPLDPATANRYSYAADNPVNNTDPTGQSIESWLGIGLVVLGLASGGVGFAIAFTAEATLASTVGGALAIADLGGSLGSAYLTGQTAN